MRSAALQPGDLVEACVRGSHFEARVEHVDEGGVHVEPVPHWATWRCLSPRQIVRRIERQGKLA